MPLNADRSIASAAAARPLVSVIVPTFNRSTLVTRAVDSVLAQTYSSVEIIVVDDGSTDDTSTVLAPYTASNTIRVIRHPVNRGVAAAKNTGLDAASGAFTTILDSDDELLPHAVETLMRAFDRLGPDVGMVFANCIDAGTGAWTGKGLTQSGPVTFADAVTEKFRGEFWAIWRTAALGPRRFDTRLAGGESIVWHDMYRSTHVYYLHECLRRYERRSVDAVSRLQFAPDQLSRTRLIYEVYLEQFGDDLLRLDPRIYAKQLQAIAMWHILAGERLRGLQRLGESVRRGRNLRQALLAVGMAVSPRFLLMRALQKRRSA